MEITVELLTIGDEILYGQIVDTNSQWMSEQVDRAGFKVIRKTSVGDDRAEIMKALSEAESRATVVLITGGLGPTSDDLTKPCLSEYFHCPLTLNEDALAEVTAFFKSRGRELTEVNRMQAMLPSCCTKLTNPHGTAPGMWFERKGKVFVSMPGVPHEMKYMMSDTVIPLLAKQFQVGAIYHHVIHTVGIGESFLADKIRDWEASLPKGVRLAYLPSPGEVKLRLTAMGPEAEKLKRQANELSEKLKSYAGEYIFGYNNDTLSSVVGRMLLDRHKTLATAESCTGGYVAHLITTVPGSSRYFMGSVIAYDNKVKIAELGVSPETIEKHGAVSEETVREMSEGVRRRLGTDIGVATSGIAGPDGGTPEKPVGTIWIAFADGNQTFAKKLQLSKDRLVNIRMSSAAVLNLIRQHLSG